MAGLSSGTGRRSRAAAARRWATVGVVARWPLAAVLVILGLFALAALVQNQALYRHPGLATLAFLGACGATALAWIRGPRGIGPVLATASGATVVGCALLLGAQLSGGDAGIGYWMSGWAVSIVAVLSFARPVDEVAVVIAALVASNAVFVAANPPAELAVRHIAPITVGTTGVMGLAVLGFAVALRTSLAAGHRSREAAEAAEAAQAAALEVAEHRIRRFAHWERMAVPLLSDIDSGAASVTDPQVVARAQALALQMRAELGASTYDSPFEAQLRPAAEAARLGGVLVDVYDAGLGHLVPAASRTALLGVLSDLLPRIEQGSLRLTVLPAETATPAVLVIVSAVGVPAPPARQWAEVTEEFVLTVEGESEWWWEGTIPIEPV